MIHRLQDFNQTGQVSDIYEQLKQAEQQWWQARQRMVALKERELLWFGNNALMMWLLWQMVSYVIMAIGLMVFERLLGISLSLEHFLTIFALQTLIFILAFVFRGKLVNRLRKKVYKADMTREQALNEMIILATDSIFPDIHANSPISLQQIYERYDKELRLASIQRLLQSEIEANRLLLDSHQIEAQILPPELADDELAPFADEMIYKSLATLN